MVRKKPMWLVGLVLLCGVVGLEARSKGEIVLEGVGDGQSVGAQKPGGKVVAVLVGINTYKDNRFRSLRYAEKDVRDLGRYLRSMGVKSRDMTLLLGKQATLRAIQRALYVWLPKKVGPKDGVFVFFSGHGEKWGVENYIVPYDAEADALQLSGLSGAVVERSLNRLRVRQQVLMLDTCFSRAIASEYVAMMENARPRSNFLPNTHLKRFQGRGRVVFTSSDGRQESLEPKDLGNGLYTHYFLKALRGEADKDGDKCITAREVHDYVSDKVPAHAQRLGREQTPAWNPNSTKEILLVRMPGCGQRIASTGTSGTSGATPSIEGWGVLVVSANVGGVKVYVDGRYRAYLRKGQSKRLKLSSGKHTVVLRKDGYSEKKEEIELEKDGELPLEMKLVKEGVDAVAERPTPRRRPTVASAQSTQGSTPSAGDRKTFTAGGVEFAMRWIPAGSFRMGSPSSETALVMADCKRSGKSDTQCKEWFENAPQRRVRISKGFWMLETEVTQAQWKGLMGDGVKPHFKNCGENCPMESVTWQEARAFADKLSESMSEKLAPCTDTDRGIFGCKGWRLPTEAEWEYAARARTTTATHNTNSTYEIVGQSNVPNLDAIAWYGGNSGVTYEGGYDCSGWAEKQYESKTCGTRPAGGKRANAWGLKDMLGNVWEWTMDWYKDSYRGLSTRDPLRSIGRSFRVFRGGSWSFIGGHVRSAFRDGYAPAKRYFNVGFRLLRSP